MSRILFFGPYSPPVTGQSLAFRVVIDSYSTDQYSLVDTTKFSFSFLNTIHSVFKSILLLLSDKSISVIYFTCTRSRLGALKDMPMLLLAGCLNKKVVNHLHGADFLKFYRSAGLLKPVLTCAYQNVSQSIVLTPSMVKEFQDFPEMKKSVIPNFYPTDFDRHPLNKPKELVVTYFSNLLKSKGILEFLEAARLVYEQRPDVQFIVAGEFMADHLMSRNQIKNKVEGFMSRNSHLPLKYIGQIDPSNRYTFLQKSQVFVLPTYYPTEGLPLSIIEAMRCGNVIISTKHNYLPDVVKRENGVLVSIHRPTEIKEVILKYVDNEVLMKQTQNYNVQEAMDNYTEVSHLKEVKRVIGM